MLMEARRWVKVAAFILGVGATFYKAYVVMLGWGWFVVPLGVPVLEYWHAFGLATLVSAMTKSTNPALVPDREPVETLGISVGAWVGTACVHFMLWAVS